MFWAAALLAVDLLMSLEIMPRNLFPDSAGACPPSALSVLLEAPADPSDADTLCEARLNEKAGWCLVGGGPM